MSYELHVTEGPGRVFADVLDLHVTEEPVRARNAKEGTRVRPSGWSEYHVVLEVQPMLGPGAYVRILWRMDPGDVPPEAYTMFAADEWLAVKP